MTDSTEAKPRLGLGDRVRDTYTGFTGILIGRTEWLYGCTRVFIESTELKDGRPIEPCAFDEQRIELVETREPLVAAESRATTGGPQRDPSPKRPGE